MKFISDNPHPVRKGNIRDLTKALRLIEKDRWEDPKRAHRHAEDALLEFIGSAAVVEAYDCVIMG